MEQAGKKNTWMSAADEATAARKLIIPQNAEQNDDLVDGLTFSPWNVDLTSFQPLGSMNRARRKVYQASAGER